MSSGTPGAKSAVELQNQYLDHLYWLMAFLGVGLLTCHQWGNKARASNQSTVEPGLPLGPVVGVIGIVVTIP